MFNLFMLLISLSFAGQISDVKCAMDMNQVNTMLGGFDYSTGCANMMSGADTPRRARRYGRNWVIFEAEAAYAILPLGVDVCNAQISPQQSLCK